MENKGQAPPIRIVVTGAHEDLESKFPSELGFNGTPLEWIPLPVLKFERLPVDEELVKKFIETPADWIIFTSRRAVKFWSELLMELGSEFPHETQVACIGEATAEEANRDGFTPDFFPVEPGTEKFIEEFQEMVNTNTYKPSILIPQAESGRRTLGEHLTTLGCAVTVIPLYRTMPKDDLARDFSLEELKRSSLILFTSPSSVDAFLAQFAVPDGVRVASIGSFTAAHLKKIGFRDFQILPQGDFERIGEIL